MLFGRRFRLKKRRKVGGGYTVTVQPDPVFRKITYGVFEAACKTLDMDPDEVFFQGCTFDDMTMPGPSQAKLFLHVVLQNSARYPVDRMPLDVYSLFMAAVAGKFFFTCQISMPRLHLA